MAPYHTPDRVGRYRDRLDALVGAAAEVQAIDPREPADGPVLALAYHDIPEPGHVTGFSYGLSLTTGPARGRELTLTVRSDDPAWCGVPAAVAAALRGLCPFRPGIVLGHAGPYVTTSAMNSVVLGSPAYDRATRPLDIGTEGSEDLIDFVGLFPIHASERELAYSQGADALWSLDWDRTDPGRAPVV
ncbi:suppressor of fused domain protein [Streptomyces halstedii]|uniref:Suppressor of fused domain protein n=1 Tax=Streptomyces halstedii TaxID=1944 RepID=A0A6N9U5S2_STRHA|nr:suppressor of fused domain protein [Streptomyces halstedii]NEA17363.1 suppressor of fused domain protein [Streptomyces halstedii]